MTPGELEILVSFERWADTQGEADTAEFFHVLFAWLVVAAIKGLGPSTAAQFFAEGERQCRARLS